MPSPRCNLRRSHAPAPLGLGSLSLRGRREWTPVVITPLMPEHGPERGANFYDRTLQRIRPKEDSHHARLTIATVYEPSIRVTETSGNSTMACQPGRYGNRNKPKQPHVRAPRTLYSTKLSRPRMLRHLENSGLPGPPMPRTLETRIVSKPHLGSGECQRGGAVSSFSVPAEKPGAGSPKHSVEVGLAIPPR